MGSCQSRAGRRFVHREPALATRNRRLWIDRQVIEKAVRSRLHYAVVCAHRGVFAATRHHDTQAAFQGRDALVQIGGAEGEMVDTFLNGAVSRRCGVPRNRRAPQPVREWFVGPVREHYRDFGPSPSMLQGISRTLQERDAFGGLFVQVPSRKRDLIEPAKAYADAGATPVSHDDLETTAKPPPKSHKSGCSPHRYLMTRVILHSPSGFHPR